MQRVEIAPLALHTYPCDDEGAAFSRPLERIERVRRLLLGAGCALLAWHIVRFGDVNFSISDLCFAACLFLLLVRRSLNIAALHSMTPFWLAGLSMMLGGLLIGSIFNGDPLRWANIALQYLFGFLFLPMIFMSEDREWIRKCLLFFVLGVTTSQLVALIAANFLTYAQSTALLGPSAVAGNGRIGGLVSDANLNGAIIGFSLVALYNSLYHKLIRPFFGLCVGGLLVWALLATASFTAFAAAALATLIYFLLSGPRRLFRIGLPVLVLLITYILMGLPLPEAFGERVLGALLTGDFEQAGTFTHRSALIAEAWHMSKDTLFVGLGVDRFRVESAYGMPVHQFWMLLLTEGGLLSLAGLVVIFATLGCMGLKALSWHREDGAMMLAILLIMVIFSTAIPHMYNRLWVAPIMMAIAATFAKSRMPSDEYGQIVEHEDFSDAAIERSSLRHS